MSATETRRRNQMLEKDFQRRVCDMATLCGFEWRHFHDSRKLGRDWKTGELRMVGDSDAAGFPDLVLVHREARLLLFRELKLDQARPSDHKPTEKQQHWIDLLAAAGADSKIWRPSDWETDIQPTLAGARRFVDDTQEQADSFFSPRNLGKHRLA